MWAGIMFQQPTERLSHLPWNGAPLVGRRLAHFGLAIDTALAAMTCVPGLALVNWDIILDETGPVLFRGQYLRRLDLDQPVPGVRAAYSLFNECFGPLGRSGPQKSQNDTGSSHPHTILM